MGEGGLDVFRSRGFDLWAAREVGSHFASFDVVCDDGQRYARVAQDHDRLILPEEVAGDPAEILVQANMSTRDDQGVELRRINLFKRSVRLNLVTMYEWGEMRMAQLKLDIQPSGSDCRAEGQKQEKG